MIKGLISVIWTMLKFICLKICYGTYFSFCGIQRFSPNTVVSLDRGGTLHLGKSVRAHSGTKIRVRRGAVISIGNDVAFNYNCMITARESIQIGDGCEIGPGVLFYDHDHDFHGHSIKESLYRTASVKLGKNVWIGANAVILRGTEIGDDSVVAAGTVVRAGVYPANSLIREEKKMIVSAIIK